MAELAFSIKAAVGGVAWSDSDQRGGFVPLHGSEVVLHPGPSLALLRAVGDDGFMLIVTLAMVSQTDDDGRLVFTGGVERVRSVVKWGRAKALKVFDDIAAKGFVVREQIPDPANGGRFTETRLVLNPDLYRPARTPISRSDGLAATVVQFLDNGDPAVRSAAVGESDNGGSTATAAPFSDSGSSDSGEPDDGDIVAGGTAVAFSDSAESHTMNDVMDEDDFSSKAEEALWALGFRDAHEVAHTTDREVLSASMAWVLSRMEEYDNPGGYLRKLISKGGPAKVDPSEALRTALGHPPAAAGDAATSSPPGIGEDDREGAGEGDGEDAPTDTAELEERLAALPDSERAAVTEALDAHIAKLPRPFRTIEPAMRAMRAEFLRELFGEADRGSTVDEGTDASDTEPGTSPAPGQIG
jgi:hypothetical protein